jgi:GH15 family glucan-1,4-alpha-glucosidase
VRPTVEVFTRTQLYFPDTAVLVTRFMTEAGVGELTDFMPVTSGGTATTRHRLVRMLRCVRGQVTFAVDIAPRFDYGRESHETHLADDGIVFQGSQTSMTVSRISEPEDERLARYHIDEQGDFHAELTLAAGQMRGLVLETGTAGPVRQVRVAEAWRLFDDTVRFWESWLAHSTYTGRWREELNRSAITLKLMTYAPSGGLVAAPTRDCPSRSAANGTGTTATPGSVRPRSRCTPCSAWGSPRKPRRWAGGCAAASTNRPPAAAAAR